MWKKYLVASGLEAECEKTKVAILLNFIGSEAARVIFKIMNIEEEGVTTEQVIKKCAIQNES